MSIEKQCQAEKLPSENIEIHNLAKSACKNLIDLERNVLQRNVSQNQEYKESLPKNLQNAISALTNTKVKVGKKFNGENYYSSDFRDHPNFSKYFNVLKTHWGENSNATPEQKKTFQIIKALKIKQDKAKKKFTPSLFSRYILRKKPTGIDENIEKSAETVWKRINGQDIFIIGIQHENEYLRSHRSFFENIIKNTSVISLETFPNFGPRKTLHSFLKNEYKEMLFQKLFNIALKNKNTSITIIDPRNYSKVSTDSLTGEMAELNKDLLTSKLNFLQKYFTKDFPNTVLNLTINSIHHLKEKIKKYALVNRYKENISENISKPILTFGKNYSSSTTLNKDNKNKSLGVQFWADNIMAIKLRKITVLQNQGKLPKGPVVKIIGEQHVDTISKMIQMPQQAYKNILQSPELSLAPSKFKYQEDLYNYSSASTSQKKEAAKNNNQRQQELSNIFNPENIKENLKKSITPDFNGEIPNDPFEIPVIKTQNPHEVIIFEGTEKIS